MSVMECAFVNAMISMKRNTTSIDGAKYNQVWRLMARTNAQICSIEHSPFPGDGAVGLCNSNLGVRPTPLATRFETAVFFFDAFIVAGTIVPDGLRTAPMMWQRQLRQRRTGVRLLDGAGSGPRTQAAVWRFYGARRRHCIHGSLLDDEFKKTTLLSAFEIHFIEHVKNMRTIFAQLRKHQEIQQCQVVSIVCKYQDYTCIAILAPRTSAALFAAATADADDDAGVLPDRYSTTSRWFKLL
eukprot:4874546-Pleurochrysis_carterae.AAC.2